MTILNKEITHFLNCIYHIRYLLHIPPSIETILMGVYIFIYHILNHIIPERSVCTTAPLCESHTFNANEVAVAGSGDTLLTPAIIYPPSAEKVARQNVPKEDDDEEEDEDVGLIEVGVCIIFPVNDDEEEGEVPGCTGVKPTHVDCVL